MNKQMKDAFDQVRADEVLKAQTKEKMLAGVSKRQAGDSGIRRRRMGTWALRYSIAAASLILLVTAGILNNSVNAQASYIRLEGNVAVGLALNEQDEVIEVQGLNEEGQQLLEEMDIVGMPYREAVDCIMSKSKGNAAGNGTIKTEVSVEGEDTEKCRRMEEEVTRQCADHEKRHGQQTDTENGEQTANSQENHGQEHQSEKSGHDGENRNSGKHNGQGRHSVNGGHE